MAKAVVILLLGTVLLGACTRDQAPQAKALNVTFLDTRDLFGYVRGD